MVAKLAIIEEFAKDAHLSSSLKNELRVAVQYSTERSSLSWNDKQSILNELPKRLRYELALAMHQGAAKLLHFFQNKDPVFVSAIVPFMQPQFIKSQDLIYSQGEYADEIYFLVSGRVSYILEEGRFVYRTLHQGAYFGDIEVILMEPRRYTLAAAVDCGLLTMKKQLMDIIQTDFPIYWSEMKTLSEERDKVNDRSKKEFLNLLALKKAGQLEKANPKIVREKVRRATVPKTVIVTPPAPVTFSSLQQQLETTADTLSEIGRDLGEVRNAAAEILAVLKGGKRVRMRGSPLSLGEKVKYGIRTREDA